MEDAETGEQLYVDTHDRGFRERFEEASRQRERGPRGRLRPRRRGGVSTLDRRRPGARDRAHGHPPHAAGGVVDDVHLAVRCCCCCCSLPLVAGGVPGASSVDRRRRLAGLGMLRLAWRRAGAAGTRRSAGYAGTCPPSLALVGLAVLVVALARPQAVVAIPRERGHGHPRLRRVRQHGRRTTCAHPHGRGQGGGDGLRRAPAGERASSASSRSATAASRSRSRPTTRTAVLAAIAPTRSAARHVARRGHPASLDTIAAAEGDQNQGYYTNRSPAPTPEPTPVPPGTHTSAVIVLLTDGENTVDPDPIEAAQVAADRGVRDPHGRHRQPRPARPSRWRASWSTRSWTSRCSSRSPR